MEVIELKFLLKLLGKQDYRAPITEIKPNSKTKATERNKICRDLCDRELVACTEEITKIKIAPAGKSLLQLDASGLPITAQELKILKACEKGAIAPSQIKITPAKARDALIDSLAARGFVEAADTKIKDAWLTERGKEYLREEYSPSGYNPVVSLEMLTNYLRFMRKFLSREVQATTVQDGRVSPQTTSSVPASKPSDDEVLQIIQDLDKQLGTDNYLPIFHLREKLQPPLLREELDQALYRLQGNDRIELSSLVDPTPYTPEQIASGIPQNIGGALFFVSVN
jgi:hypothetical protein